MRSSVCFHVMEIGSHQPPRNQQWPTTVPFSAGSVKVAKLLCCQGDWTVLSCSKTKPLCMGEMRLSPILSIPGTDAMAIKLRALKEKMHSMVLLLRLVNGYSRVPTGKPE